MQAAAEHQITEKQQENVHIDRTSNPNYLSSDEEFFYQCLLNTGKRVLFPVFTPVGLRFEGFDKIHKYYTDEEIKRLLESLSAKSILSTVNLGITLLCPSCRSPGVMVTLTCNKCESTKLKEDRIVTHPSCGYQGNITEFQAGSKQICPQCKENITEEDLKLVKSSYRCESCGSQMRNVKTSLLCLKCKTQFTHQRGVQENPVGYIVDVIYPKFGWVKERRTLNEQAASIKQEVQEKIKPNIPREPAEHPVTKPPQQRPQQKIAQTQTKTPPKKHPVPLKDETLKVLLVEKQKIHADLIENSLQNKGTNADITSVNSGRRALKQLRNTFNLILLDSELTDVDSSHILYEIRKWSIQSPVVVLTSDITKKEKFLKNGALKVLEKSIETYRALPEIIQEIYS